MSHGTRELLEVLLALSPWIAFVIAVAWSSASAFLHQSDRSPGDDSSSDHVTPRRK
jgi:hypothetical protein